jgi:hypothetical protein
VRTPQPQFVVHKSPTPNGKKSWYIIGRPHSERVRAWFDTEVEAENEANRRNQEMQKERSAKYGGKSAASAVLPPLTVTDDDELFQTITGSLREIAREILRLRQENTRLQKENTDLRNFQTEAREIFKMDDETRSLNEEARSLDEEQLRW